MPLRSLLAGLGSALLTVLLALAPAARAQPAPVHTLEPPEPFQNQRFGEAVALVPDTDGDGQPDLLVGSPGVPVGGVQNVGRAYLYSGATGALLHTIESPYTGGDGRFGESVAGLEDVDGDGRGDLLIGARNALPNLNGQAYVVSGATGALIHTLTSPTSEPLGEFGSSVAGLPDVDGDGVWELVVGAQREDIGGMGNAGRVHVFSGATGGLLYSLTRSVPLPNRWFGWDVAAVPDADGDGRHDLLVSGYPAVDGRVYLISGADGTHLREFASPNPELNNGHFGEAVAGLPDVDGDGRGDLAVGAIIEDGGALDAGRVYVFSGATGLLLRTLESPTPVIRGHFGRALSLLPDADGDGQADLAVGASSETGGALQAGRVHVFSLVTGAHLASYQSPNPRQGYQYGSFGYAVAGLPDVSGDGAPDILIGSRGETVSGMTVGRAYVFSGAVATAVESPPAAPDLALSVSPNPAHGVATLTFTLAAPGAVRLTVYDALGREVAVLAEGARAAGAYNVDLDAPALPPGLYVARLSSGGCSVARRLVVAR